MMFPAQIGLTVARPFADSPAPTRALDAYASTLTTDALVYSIGYQLFSTYTGALIRIRRESDNAELDISPTSSGVLDTSAISTFCGASNGRLVSIYSQRNTNNISSTILAEQPMIYNGSAVLENSIGRIGAKFDGTNDIMTFASFPLPAGNQDVTIMMDQDVALKSGNDQYLFWLGDAIGGRSLNFQLNNANKARTSTWGPDVDLDNPNEPFIQCLRYSMSEQLLKGSTHTLTTSAYNSATLSALNLDATAGNSLGGTPIVTYGGSSYSTALFGALLIDRQHFDNATTEAIAAALKGAE
jgi:hypothetical protein